MPCLLNENEILVLSFLSYFAIKYDETYPSQKLIASKLKKSIRQVQRIIKSLKEKQFLNVVRTNTDKSKHMHNKYELKISDKCRLECRLECRLLIYNNKYYYNNYLHNYYNNLYKNNTYLEDKKMINKHLSILKEKNLYQSKSEDVYKYFYLICKMYNFSIPYEFLKKDIGIIKKIKKSLENDKDLKGFIEFVVSEWSSLIYKYKIVSLVPNLSLINLKFYDLYNEYKSRNKQEESATTGFTGKFVKKEG